MNTYRDVVDGSLSKQCLICINKIINQNQSNASAQYDPSIKCDFTFVHQLNIMIHEIDNLNLKLERNLSNFLN